MRVSNSMIYNDFNRNVAHNMNKLQKYHNQLSTLKEYNQSSDNPVEFSKILDLNDSVLQNGFYNSTIGDAIAWSNSQDAALSHATDSFHRIRGLLTQAANGTQGVEEQAVTKSEIMSEIEGIVDVLNTNFDGRYVFGGKNTKDAPFEVEKDANGDITGILYNGTENGKANLPREISRGVSVDLITDGRLFMNETTEGTKSEDLSTFFSEMITALNGNDKDALSGKLITKLSDHAENFVDVRSRIGTVSNRLTSAKSRNEMESLNIKQVLSEKQDVDVAEKYMEFANEMVAYQASLSMGTKIMQTSILDYV
ncbi:flagellar hook-associated protein FlgL [Vagococcus sp.]|uniref:flagellar hook-associated protein FlgL n=1 Tax=Vagococcus sp. TaxID=1933889 RepID=UPI003F9D5AEA